MFSTIGTGALAGITAGDLVPLSNKGGKAVYFNRTGGTTFQLGDISKTLPVATFDIGNFDDDPTKTRNNIDHTITDEDDIRAAEELDRWTLALALDNLDKYFPGKTAEQVTRTFRPTHISDKFGHRLKVKVNVGPDDKRPAKFYVMDDALKSTPASSWKIVVAGTSIISKLQLTGLWIQSAQWGLTIDATRVHVCASRSDVVGDTIIQPTDDQSGMFYMFAGAAAGITSGDPTVLSNKSTAVYFDGPTRFQLGRVDRELPTVPFAINNFEKDPTKDRQNMVHAVNDPEEAAAGELLDTWVTEHMITHREKYFPGQDEQGVRAGYVPVFSVTKYGAQLKCKVNVSGKRPASFFAVADDGASNESIPWTSVASQSRVVSKLRISGVWIIKSQWGISVDVEKAFVFQGENDDDEIILPLGYVPPPQEKEGREEQKKKDDDDSIIVCSSADEMSILLEGPPTLVRQVGTLIEEDVKGPQKKRAKTAA